MCVRVDGFVIMFWFHQLWGFFFARLQTISLMSSFQCKNVTFVEQLCGCLSFPFVQKIIYFLTFFVKLFYKKLAPFVFVLLVFLTVLIYCLISLMVLYDSGNVLKYKSVFKGPLMPLISDKLVVSSVLNQKRHRRMSIRWCSILLLKYFGYLIVESDNPIETGYIHTTYTNFF